MNPYDHPWWTTLWIFLIGGVVLPVVKIIALALVYRKENKR